MASGSIPPSGLIHAYLLDGKGGGRRWGWDDIPRWTPQQGVLWLHFDYSAAAVRPWIQGHSNLDPLVAEALLSEETRPRATAIGEGLLMALRGVNLKAGADPDDMVSIRLWAEPTRIISTRHRRLLSVDDLVQRLDAGKGPTNAADFVVELTDRLIWRMSDTVDQFEDRIAELEHDMLSAYSHELKYELATLRRQTIGVRRYLAPQRDALARLFTEKIAWMTDQNRLYLREINDRLLRHIEDLDAVRERAAVAQEELLGRLSEQLNNRMYVLSIVAAIFLPLGFLTGLLGVNVGGIPGAENPLAFYEFLILMVAIVTVQIWVFRRRKWL